MCLCLLSVVMLATGRAGSLSCGLLMDIQADTADHQLISKHVVNFHQYNLLMSDVTMYSIQDGLLVAVKQIKLQNVPGRLSDIKQREIDILKVASYFRKTPCIL